MLDTNCVIYRFRGYVESNKDIVLYKDVCADNEDDAVYKMEQYAEWCERNHLEEFVVIGKPEVQLTCVIA